MDNRLKRYTKWKGRQLSAALSLEHGEDEALVMDELDKIAAVRGSNPCA